MMLILSLAHADIRCVLCHCTAKVAFRSGCADKMLLYNLPLSLLALASLLPQYSRYLLDYSTNIMLLDLFLHLSGTNYNTRLFPCIIIFWMMMLFVLLSRALSCILMRRQICRFCWHHIKQNLNGRCPACRRKYSDNSVEFKAMSQDE